MRYKIAIFILSVTFVACQKDEKGDVHPEGYLTGGETTIFSAGPDAFTFPLANLDEKGITEHFEADVAFGQHFVSAPSTQAGGLGPIYNQNSCESCHIRNGRGIIPQFDNDPNSGLLLRLSVPGQGLHNEPLPVPMFGLQYQTKAIFGTQSEGSLTINEVEKIVEYLDGSETTLRRFDYILTNTYEPLPGNVLTSPRLAPPVHGLGLLEAISEADILQNEDITDADGDGISGKANRVWDVIKNDLSIGRFGWKAEQPTAGQQAADAAHNDMGLTSFYFPEEHCLEQSNCTEGLQTAFDLDQKTVELMAFYFQTLAVPSRRNTNEKSVRDGEDLFYNLNCNGCHTPTFITGEHTIDALSNQKIHPFTDLLLHDMGEGLADKRPTFLANGSEWRTAPLWGVGLTQVINSKATYLHDGRASTIEEAILWHGGEAQQSRDKFLALNKKDREALIAFVTSL